MKQYTNESQTAKLIELGFEKPSSIASVEPIYGMGGISVAKAYSIGELIEMLPTDNNIGWNIRKHNSITDISKTQYSVIVDVNMFLSAYTTESEKLIDALYDMIVKLKEEGVI
ncbi:MAG: hypothetical protein IKA96_05030 [Alistipes sp.]|nr:hypothetical protein [Alistipes sp.]MBR3794393.1 hypothetical protein [Alistipes sp.]